MTLVAASTGPRLTAPEFGWRGQQGPADTTQITRSTDQQRAVLPWALLVGAVALSLGSNVFAVLQIGAAARSIGGVIYGAWPTLAFLAAAWLWHREGRRGSTARGPWHWLLVWTLRVAVAVPAAYVSLLHVHETALHFGQAGAMSWAEAVGMEAVTALALVEIDAGHLLRPPPLLLEEGQDDEGQADAEVPTKRPAIEAAARADLLTRSRFRPATEYAVEHGVSRQYANRILRELASNA